MVYRVYVEKKKELANEAASLLGDARSLLGITNLTDVRVINRYDAENITEELFDYAKKTVFSEPQLDIASDEVLYGSIAELMYDFGILSDSVAERYAWGDLGDMWSETYNMQRVMYVTFEVVVPANGSVQVDATMMKDASIDHVGEGTDRNGYDMVTQVGSTLEFSGVTASVSNSQFIEIIYQNFGFDLENGITKVELDVNEPHYYMEVRKVYTEGEEKAYVDWSKE